MRLRKTDVFLVVRSRNADLFAKDGIPTRIAGSRSDPHRAYDSLEAAEFAADDLDLCSDDTLGHGVAIVDRRLLPAHALGPDDGILEGRALRRRVPAAAIRGWHGLTIPF